MTEKTEDCKKTPMSDEERMALCQKLDKELDEFIDSLEKKKYTDGWPEDRWEEEMDKHPFFMKSAPEGELSPLAEGLAKLKYDPEENTPLELATSYKEDGNFNFKHRNYRLAIMGYTEGIRVKCDDAEMNASLYNNRAAAHWHLKNYRSALFDSEKALSFNPGHTKARVRAAKSAFEITKYDICEEHCQKLLETEPTNKEFTELLKLVRRKRMIQERDERKQITLDARKQKQRDEVIKAIIERGIKINKCEDLDDLDLSKLEPCMPGAENAIVHLDKGVLNWPILLLYPEYQQTDLVRDCPENVPIISQLEQIFPAPWDDKNRYHLNTVNLYYEGTDDLPHIIDPTRNLGDVLVMKNFVVKSGTPSFFVVPRGTQFEKGYLESYFRR